MDRDFRDFEDWFWEKRGQEYGEIVRSSAEVAISDIDRTKPYAALEMLIGGMTRAQSNGTMFMLECYHEWLSGQQPR